jgi:ABC-type lipoprotein release transport system permease subunit
VVKDVLSESALIVGLGGLISLPLGLLLASGLDRILKGMPGIPADLHFFVFEGTALATHVGLLAATAIIAALYPMRIVSSLPIAATLRDEVIG